jgi:hypothetical protein
MSDELILSFPTLKQDSSDFLESVVYTVEATQHQNARKLIVRHSLKGNSFIAELIKNKKAKFLVVLFYKDNAERQKFICDKYDYDENTQEISATQNIDIDFSYAPEITPCIVVMNDEKISVNEQSGLTDFWQNEEFDIPSFSRVAYHLKLKFTSGNIYSLLNVQCDENYQQGSIKTIVSETTNEGEQPIKVVCAKDVFDELKKDVPEKPTDAKTAMRSAIVAQVLCHVYAHMNNLDDKETDVNSGLLLHMEELKNKTGQDWQSEDFNASFASTKMLPYAIEALNNEDR